jgi:hypothetical protein
MASDSDGSTSSAAVLRAIRDKLVEYKESLLRYALPLWSGSLVCGFLTFFVMLKWL